MYQLTCSVVLYNNDEEILNRLINCVLRCTLNLKFYLIDNSETDVLKSLAVDERTEYIFNGKNLGYGKAHNIAMKKALTEAKYHLVLNPDIEFEEGVLEEIYNFLETHKHVGQVMPKVFYTNGNLQKLCHLLPSPIDLVSRRFFEDKEWAQKLNEQYEIKDFKYDRCLNVPSLSGCFMFLRSSALKEVGLFDERFFMYMEDIDLTRRIHAKYETLFYPDAEVIHGFEKESYTNIVILKYHIVSAIKYFSKWGWFFDKKRTLANSSVLSHLYTSSPCDN